MKFFGPPTTKWRPCKIFAKLNGNHLLMANIFKLHEYQTFGLMKMHNMCKIWFANKIFSLLRWNKKYFSWFFKGFQLPEIILRLQLYWPLKEDFCVISQKILRAAILRGTVAQILSYYWILNLQNLLRQSFKKYVENTYFEPKEKGPFFSNFALVSHFSITRLDILIFCNILHLEMNLGNFY